VVEPIISVSGLRGVVGDTLTLEVAIRYAAAFAASVPDGTMLVSNDGRSSGFMLSRAVQSGLEAVGRPTVNVGIAATPTVGILVKAYKAVGAIQVTASHNPPEYNGLKLFSSEGRIIPGESGQKVLERYRQDSPSWVGHELLGSCGVCEDSTSAHLEAILKTVDVDRIRKCKFKVLLDSNHGAGSIVGKRLLDELRCSTTILGQEPDGKIDHPAEPTAKNLATVLAAVPKYRSDVGFCQDPDADRLAVIDASGRYVGEEYTLAMCIDHILRQRTGPIVVNCSTSNMSRDLAAKYGVPFYRSAVGEPNVVDMMLSKGAIFGGEGNGGPIDPRVGLVRDSFVGMAQLLDAMAARRMTIGKLADELPRYEIVKKKVAIAREAVSEAFDALSRYFSDAKPDHLDGLRLDWNDAWLLVRPSNTEPIVRAVAEASTAAKAEQLCQDAVNVLKNL